MLKAKGADTIVRGLRAVSDFEYEFKYAHMNEHLAPEIEVVCFMTSSRLSFISSSFIREVASLGGDIHGLVPGQCGGGDRGPAPPLIDVVPIG